jgi:hypothetical protein
VKSPLAPPHQALTLSSQSRLRVIQTPCEICAAYSAKTAPNPLPAHLPFQGIWDTGATHSAISQNVVDQCGLKQVGLATVHGVHGAEVRPQFLVNIKLHNAQVHDLLVTSADLGGVDALIGMDVITLGDFAITNLRGRTTFTFRIPSIATIDYTEDATRTERKAMAKSRPPGGSVNPATRGRRR